MSRPQTAGQNYNIKLVNSRCFENVAKCKFFGTAVANQNFI
jgi:hypothetical protein